MTYSSIINNPYCKCGCGRVKTLGYEGYNLNCRPDLREAKLKKNNQRKALVGDGTKIRKLAPPAIDNKVEDAQMSLYWMLAKKEISKHPHCMECGKKIPEKIKLVGKKFTLDGYRCATAHVLPKRKEYGFPSVASNPINRLFLGAGCGCHDRYDRSWEDAAKMKVWPLAVEIFKKLYPLIHPSEKKNIPDILLQELDPAA